jgi:predicted DNA binding CopG/RHH family protein
MSSLEQRSTEDVRPNFAGMLARASSSEERARKWLAEDESIPSDEEITSLSYEQALRKHARRPSVDQTSERIDRVATMAAEALEERRKQARVIEQEPIIEEPGRSNNFAAAESAAFNLFDEKLPGDTVQFSTPLPQPSTEVIKAAETKAVSVTLRVSQQEANQLRKRAATAGLTVSAYIRSCVCEADLLRAQVKSALIEMRQASTQTNVNSSANRHWWGRLVARG